MISTGVLSLGGTLRDQVLQVHSGIDISIHSKSAVITNKDPCRQSKLGFHLLATRAQISTILKQVGGFSNRVIAAIMQVGKTTIERDLKQRSPQLAHYGPAAVSSTSDQFEQKSLGFDGKHYSTKRDSDTKMRDYLEYAYLYDYNFSCSCLIVARLYATAFTQASISNGLLHGSHLYKCTAA